VPSRQEETRELSVLVVRIFQYAFTERDIAYRGIDQLSFLAVEAEALARAFLRRNNSKPITRFFLHYNSHMTRSDIMRMIYITGDSNAFLSNRGKGGVFKKISSQLSELQKLGVFSELVIMNKYVPYHLPEDIHVRFREARTAPYRNVWEKIRSSSDIAQAIGEEIESSDERSILYIRGLSPSPKMIRTLRKKRKCRVVFELQSFAEREAALRGSRETVLAMKLFYGKVLRYADGIVGVTNEIALHYFKMSKRRDLPYLANGNGIDVTSVPLRTPPEFDGRNLNLLSVAQVAKWHGLDRIIRGIACNDGKTNIRFHVVGDGSEIPNLKKLVSDLGLEENVLFHGFKTGKELDELFNKCHIAVGSLGAHRKGLSQTSELKAREYCARGIPFICSVPDADFPAGFPYVLRVNSSEEPVDVEQIISFARTICSKDDHRHEMREYAMNNLDWSIKMKKLVEFLSGILQNKDDR